VEESAFASQVAAAGLAERVVLWGWAGREELGGILAAADLGLVTRFPTAGETSAAALRFLAAATPVVVSGYRQFLELPPEAAFRIAPGEAGLAELVRLLAWLGGDAEARASSRLAARRAWELGGHAPAAAAAALARALGELGAGVV